MALNTEMRFLEIQRRMAAAVARRPPHLSTRPVRLVAVSKLQSIESILALYQCGQRVFGENYIQELLTKAADSRIKSECPDIEWRFIGHLQTNKANQLMRVKRLTAVQTLDSLKVAKALDKACVHQQLQVMVQVNTSQESNKKGVAPNQVLALVHQIQQQCPQLRVTGLMTIGRFGHDPNEGPNPDFEALIQCGEEVRANTGLDVQLSFGMSDDMEHAIEMGSHEVRVGTALFGTRNKE